HRHNFVMRRVAVRVAFGSPARPGDTVRIGLNTIVENPRRLRHLFEIRNDATDQLLAEGFVRVGSVDLTTFAPRDLPADVLRLLSGLPDLIERQARGTIEIPWT